MTIASIKIESLANAYMQMMRTDLDSMNKIAAAGQFSQFLVDHPEVIPELCRMALRVKTATDVRLAEREVEMQIRTLKTSLTGILVQLRENSYGDVRVHGDTLARAHEYEVCTQYDPAHRVTTFSAKRIYNTEKS